MHENSKALTLLVAKILALSEIRDMEAEFGGNRKVALILSWQRGEQGRLMLQELFPASMSSLGASMRKGSKSGVGDEEQR